MRLRELITAVFRFPTTWQTVVVSHQRNFVFPATQYSVSHDKIKSFSDYVLTISDRNFRLGQCATDFSNHSEGIYFIEMQTEEGRSVKKIILQ